MEPWNRAEVLRADSESGAHPETSRDYLTLIVLLSRAVTTVGFDLDMNRPREGRSGEPNRTLHTGRAVLFLDR